MQVIRIPIGKYLKGGTEMVKHRWTYEEIRTTGIRQFIKAILEREGASKNPVSPLAVKIAEGVAWTNRVVDPVERNVPEGLEVGDTMSQRSNRPEKLAPEKALGAIKEILRQPIYGTKETGPKLGWTPGSDWYLPDNNVDILAHEIYLLAARIEPADHYEFLAYCDLYAGLLKKALKELKVHTTPHDTGMIELEKEIEFALGHPVVSQLLPTEAAQTQPVPKQTGTVQLSPAADLAHPTKAPTKTPKQAKAEVTKDGQAKMIPGKDIQPRITRASSKHRPAVRFPPEKKAEILRDYLMRGSGTKGYGPDGKWLYKETEIFTNHKTTSGGLNRIIWEYGPKGELFRQPRKKQLPMKGLPPAEPVTTVPSPASIEEKLFLPAETPASKLWFEGWKRKKWANIYQKALWEKCEKDVGSVNMSDSARWALSKGISNINSVITYAMKLKKRYGYR